jgi:hypothetical protein
VDEFIFWWTPINWPTNSGPNKKIKVEIQDVRHMKVMLIEADQVDLVKIVFRRGGCALCSIAPAGTFLALVSQLGQASRFVPFLYRRLGRGAFLAFLALEEPITYIESIG